MNLQPLDLAVLLLYFLIIGSIGLYIARRQRTASEYFVADRRIPGWAVAFNLMATLISSNTLIGYPGVAYKEGFILLAGVLMLPVVLSFVAIWIVPFYRNVVKMSAYEYIGNRFGPTARTYASLGFLADRLFDLGGTLLTTAIPINVMTGWPLGWVILGVAAFTILYTAVGGMEAIVWTDVAQGIILILGGVIILVRLLSAPEAGPWGATATAAWDAGKFSPGNWEWSWAAFTDPSKTTQWILVVAISFNWARRYVCDQHMVQRYLIAKTDRAAQVGTMINAAACVPIYVMFMVIGALLYGFYTLSGKPVAGNADEIVPFFVIQELRPGLIGLFLSAILAASMSSISADLNSVATVLTADYFKRLAKHASDRAMLLFGKSMVLAGGLIAGVIAVLLNVGGGGAGEPVMKKIVTVASILSGGTLGLFFLGFLTTRANARGCVIGIAACLLFTAWGVLTQPGTRLLDMGVNFPFHPALLGVLGHFVLFFIGYGASLLLPDRHLTTAVDPA
jgi:solute:Na+ symporter, SSS family